MVYRPIFKIYLYLAGFSKLPPLALRTKRQTNCDPRWAQQPWPACCQTHTDTQRRTTSPTRRRKTTERSAFKELNPNIRKHNQYSKRQTTRLVRFMQSIKYFSLFSPYIFYLTLHVTFFTFNVNFMTFLKIVLLSLIENVPQIKQQAWCEPLPHFILRGSLAHTCTNTHTHTHTMPLPHLLQPVARKPGIKSNGWCGCHDDPNYATAVM